MTNSNANYHNLFSSKEEYFAFIARWKELARAKKLTAQDCLLRCVLLQQDVERVMPVTKNETRLANGAATGSGRCRAASAMKDVDPVRALERRMVRERDLRVTGREVHGYLAELSWGERWVGAAEPASFRNGLSLARLLQAVELARKVAA